MKIFDERISNIYCIDVEIGDISKELVSSWLFPFFQVYEENIYNFEIMAKIKLINGINKDYDFKDNVFYINANMSINKILYTMMSILRVLYKYVASLLDYQNLHAACLNYNDKGILIKADRNQGKTTLLLKAIENSKFSLLANDQVMYNIENRRLLGYPAAIGVRNNSCDYIKQKQINKRALWFIDDPFQTYPKPVIHIKDLSEIYHCNIARSTNLNILVSYEKSTIENELVITQNKTASLNINDIKLPLNKTYKEDVLKACIDSVDYYIGNDFCKNEKVNYCNDFKLYNQLYVKCGINRISDMLLEIMYILK